MNIRLPHALLIAAIVFLGGMDAASAAVDVKMSDMMSSNPALRADSIIESANRDSTTRSLRQKSKVLGNDYASKVATLEERGIFKSLFGKTLDLKTVSDDTLAKLMNNEKARVKAFKYLDNNGEKAHIRLGGPNMGHESTREKFWKSYGRWIEVKYPDVGR